MDARLDPIDPDASFRFCCSPRNSCFNECCRNLNQFLTPYDVLRLKNALGLSSDRFLGRYTRRHTGPGSGLPVVTLVPADPEKLTCPFLASEGCRVYPDRPSSCRTYPLVRILRRSRNGEGIMVEYRLLREPHCRGFDAAQLQSVTEWTADQGLADCNAENDRFLEVIAIKARLSTKALPPSLADQVYTAFYDLDRFRARLSGDCPAAGGSPIERVESSRMDDTALLHLSLEWVQRLLNKALAR